MPVIAVATVVVIVVKIANANKNVQAIALAVARKARLANALNKAANAKKKLAVAVKNMCSRFLENLNVNASRVWGEMAY